MPDWENERRLIVQAAKWGVRVGEQIRIAGGAADSLINRFPDELIDTMVRNSMEVKYCGKRTTPW